MTERLTPARRPPNSLWRCLQHLCLTSFVWCLLMTPGRAHADVTRDELARRHFQVAKVYYERGEYEPALDGFVKAYELSKRPEILVSISLANEKMKRFEPAIEALDRFLVLAADHPDADTVRSRRNALRERLATTPPPPPRTPEPTKERSPPEAAATPSQSPAATESDPTAATPAVPVRPPHQQASPAASAPAPVRWPAYLLLGTGGASLIGALTTGLFAELEYGDLEGRCAPACSPAEIKPGRTMQTTSRVLTGVGLVAVGVGAWLWWDSDPKPTAHEPVAGPRLNVAVGARSGVATATWSF